MTCTVTLWDSSSNPITIGKIDVEAFDPPSRSIDRKSNSPLPSGTTPHGAHGAVLGVSAGDIFDVIVHTTGTRYAPPVLETFTGDGSSQQLDVVLFSTSAATKTGSVGAAPTSPDAVGNFIMDQSWEIEAKRAIRTIVATTGYLKRLPSGKVASSLKGELGELEELLRKLRINPDLV